MAPGAPEPVWRMGFSTPHRSLTPASLLPWFAEGLTLEMGTPSSPLLAFQALLLFGCTWLEFGSEQGLQARNWGSGGLVPPHAPGPPPHPAGSQGGRAASQLRSSPSLSA